MYCYCVNYPIESRLLRPPPLLYLLPLAVGVDGRGDIVFLSDGVVTGLQIAALFHVEVLPGSAEILFALVLQRTNKYLCDQGN